MAAEMPDGERMTFSSTPHAGLPASVPHTLVLVISGLLILVILVLLVVRRQGALAALFGSSIDASTRIALSFNFGK